MKHTPVQVRNWFKLHFVIDMIFAFPLFFAPVSFLGFFGFETVEVNLARLVAAALFAIGGMSLWMNRGSYDSFMVMLRLKLLWSAAATLGLVWGALEGGPKSLWLFAIIFAGFFCVWQWWYVKMRQGI
ncbi:hypothetical protein CL619_00965 [archaeon]|nr:hypothetical protein [archaeon]|tara:strand:+ start:456 stop:839 length:384 start_codon:yes stop_codon:yes gene_type:complete